MAIHSTTASMLKESLPELLYAAKFCAKYRKDCHVWGKFKTGGCLGFPAAILLFSIVDSIGSYFRGNKNIEITIDSKPTLIKGTGSEHFKILNSKYFNQDLSGDCIEALYEKFRSLLVHNSAIGKNTSMNISNGGYGGPFQEMTIKTEKIYYIYINEFCDLCEEAINEFIKDIDSIVPISKQGKNFH